MKEKNSFIGEDFLLQNEIARKLYHEYAAQMPIIDYHCHLPVQQIAENYTFQNLTDLWLRGDHYKWRAMRALGVDEKYITGGASDDEKFLRWGEIVPLTVRNPLFHWTQLELKNPFGITDLLNKNNAKEIYDHCNELLQQPAFTAQGLLKHFGAQTVCTTDDPCDDLHYHAAIQKSNLTVKVIPAFRPDKVLHIAGGNAFIEYIQKLSGASGISVKDIDSLLDALQQRIEYFHERGGRLADHGLNYIPEFTEENKKEIDNHFKKALKGEDTTGLSKQAQDNYAGFILLNLCRMYHKNGWVQQFHLGALRNTNVGKLKKFGADTGFDSIGDFPQASSMATFFDKLDRTGQLARTILYNLNPADNEIFATMAGNFSEGPVKGKMQFGAAWWFLDQLDGMEKQINALSNMSILSSFVGMLTDSRCFLSYSRHEYFRRLLCNIFGKDMEAGLIPRDEKWIGKIIQDICYNNAKEYFRFDK
jgi:glucuronate isomerase